VPKTPKSGAGLERNQVPLSAEITCRFRPKSGAGLLRFLYGGALAVGCQNNDPKSGSWVIATMGRSGAFDGHEHKSFDAFTSPGG
jgi:hypothetical protein